MRSKPLVLLTIALGCGMVAAVGVSQVLRDSADGGSEPMVEILVATKDLSQADKITAENVKLEKWPKKRVPEGALTKLEQVEGKFTRQMIFAGEPLLKRKITDSRASFSLGVPAGYRIFDIECNAAYIKPGDHVDIVGIFERPGSGVPETRTVMRNVKVHGINGNTSRDADETAETGRSPRKMTFQLLVRESQLEALALAKGMGELQLHLRPLDEKEDDTSDNGQNFLAWVRSLEQVEAEPQESTTNAAVTPGIFTSTKSDGAVAGGPGQKSPQLAPARHRMVIITPSGITEYEWTDENRLPRPVSPEEDEYETDGEEDESENVSTGYGGYSPKYPNGAIPSDTVKEPLGEENTSPAEAEQTDASDDE